MRAPTLFTMTDGAVIPPPAAFPVSYGSDNYEFGFQYKGWEDIPVPSGLDWFRTDERYRRNANAECYRAHGDPIAWTRYLTLGFFAFTDCTHFDNLWAKRETDTVNFHRVIWYQFMSYVQKELPIPEKLSAWALQITHPFLEFHDASALDVDTSIPWKELANNDPMETDDIGDWLTVQGKRRGRDSSPPKIPPKLTRLTKRTHLPMQPAATSKALLTADKDYRKLVKSVAKVPGMTTVDETEEDEEVEVVAWDNDTIAASTMESQTETASENTSIQKPASFPMVSVNDGTHRVKIKWTLNDDVTQYESDTTKLNESIRELLLAMFQDDDGMLYRWQSDDLTKSSIPSAMSSTAIRAHISPAVTCLKSKSMIIFGIRFGFTDNPVKWQMTDATKKMLQEKNVEVTISNSTSMSGNIVTAGYILLKSPTMTSTHRYTQYLRSQLPDATPYFDVIKYRKTPFDQSIPHLAIQCGEKHVTPVSQALSKAVSGGTSTAVFLPRYAFGAMTDQQIEHQFASHHKWSRSLKSIALAPLVFHLDQKRVEYCADGTTIERSTREWAATLTCPDGSPALCDVVNGTSDKKALLLAPEHYVEVAKAELKKYRARLYPPRHREARFRDRVSDFPAVIHIQTAIASNVNYIENLFSSETWTSLSDAELPAQSRNTPIQQKPRPNTKKADVPRRDTGNAWNTAPNIQRPNGKAKTFANQAGFQKSVASVPIREDQEILDDERSTASTQGTTVASDTTLHAKLLALESATKSKLNTLATSSKQSLENFKRLEKQMQRFMDLDYKVESVEKELSSMSVKLDDSVTAQQDLSENVRRWKRASKSQFNSVSEHLVTSGETVNQLTGTMEEMRSEMGRMSLLLHGLATRQLDQELTQSKQPTPTSNHQEHPTETLVDPRTTGDIEMLNGRRTLNQVQQNRHPLPRPTRDAASIPLPDSSENSVTSSTSKTSLTSMHTEESDTSRNSQTSSIVQSPPSKKTRQSGTPTAPMRGEDNGNLEIDSEEHDVFNEDADMFDAVIEEAIRTNLTSRFDASIRQTPTSPLTEEQESNITPTPSPDTSQSPLPLRAEEVSPPHSPSAPLDPRNKINTGSAGALTE